MWLGAVVHGMASGRQAGKPALLLPSAAHQHCACLNHQPSRHGPAEKRHQDSQGKRGGRKAAPARVVGPCCIAIQPAIQMALVRGDGHNVALKRTGEGWCRQRREAKRAASPGPNHATAVCMVARCIGALIRLPSKAPNAHLLHPNSRSAAVDAARQHAVRCSNAHVDAASGWHGHVGMWQAL